MENGPFEDVFPIENGDFPASYVSLSEGIRFLTIGEIPHWSDLLGRWMPQG